jgi:hypothetical protein
MNPYSSEIERVTIALGDLKDRCLLAGGASIPYYITDALEETPRVTDDIDVVIEVRTAAEFRGIEAQLREQGFLNDTSQGAPICRWLFDGIKVDVMPSKESILGFAEGWHQAGFSTAMQISVTDSCLWRILSPPFAMAAKFAAFWDRGVTDPGASTDLEDIISIVNGRPEMGSELANAETACRDYVGDSISKILASAGIMDVIQYHLPPAGQQRATIVHDRLKKMAKITDGSRTGA